MPCGWMTDQLMSRDWAHLPYAEPVFEHAVAIEAENQDEAEEEREAVLGSRRPVRQCSPQELEQALNEFDGEEGKDGKKQRDPRGWELGFLDAFARDRQRYFDRARRKEQRRRQQHVNGKRGRSSSSASSSTNRSGRSRSRSRSR